jgi:acyl-CoA synthetase (NDP forming)
LDRILVQHMVQAGAELLVSAFRDPDFGVMLSLGAGGTLTELLDDIVLVRPQRARRPWRPHCAGCG